MIFNHIINEHSLTKGSINFNILESGDVSTIKKGNVQINLLQGNNIEGSCSNLYLRIIDEKEIFYTKLIGVDSPSRFYIENNKAFYKGIYQSIEYLVVLTVLDNIWFWDVELTNMNHTNKIVDVIYGQDVAIAHANAIRSNEAYVCQYIDHKVFKNDGGYTVCTRQNQGTPHYLQQGSLTPNISYSTDGFQFFGLDYKVSNQPIALLNKELENKNYQYEFAYTALMSEQVNLHDQANFVFYGLFEDNIKEVATGIRFEETIRNAYEAVKHEPIKLNEAKFNKLERKLNLNQLLNVMPFTIDEIDKRYPNKRHIEEDLGTLLSFFNEDSSHIVLKEKESIVERPHGNIIITGNNLLIKDDLISSTHFIFGVFNSHIVVGNSSFNKFSTNVRNPLNVAKLSGQRILVEIDGVYKLLGVPSLFELGINYSKWFYKLNNDVITITSMVLVDSPQLILDVKSENGIKYSYIVLNHLLLGANEYEFPFEVMIDKNNLEFIPNEKSMCYDKHPHLRYNMHIIASQFTVNDDRIFYTDNESRNQPLLTLTVSNSESFRIVTQGRINGESYELTNDEFDDVKNNYQKFFSNNVNHFKLSIDNDAKEEVDKFNDIIMWYTHNALIHYASPHGLEQYNGAAWGTRDVCQGPVEYFMATQKYDVVRDILLKVYARQFKQNGDFPQWFMFGEYSSIQAGDSHGDIIVWPLRTLAIYLQATSDYSILEEKVTYTDLHSKQFTIDEETILNHVLYQIDAIKDGFIKDTCLSCYGGGDWDDTLQPANKAYANNMVSGWTVALTYEAMNYFADTIKVIHSSIASQIMDLADSIKSDYFKYMIGVFCYMYIR